MEPASFAAKRCKTTGTVALVATNSFTVFRAVSLSMKTIIEEA
jgi:hypothetical protein